jgi:hypothetical protein
LSHHPKILLINQACGLKEHQIGLRLTGLPTTDGKSVRYRI